MDVAPVEADDLDLAGTAAAFDGLDDADGGGFARAEQGLEAGVGGEDVCGRGAGASAVAHAEPAGDEPDGRELAFEGFPKATLAEAGGGASGLLHNHGYASLPLQETANLAGRPAAGGGIVGGDEGDVILEVHGRIEDVDGNARGGGPLEGGGSGDKGVDDLNLPGGVGLLVRPVPEPVDVTLPGGAVDAGVDGNKEEMGGGLGDHGDAGARALGAGDEAATGEQMATG